MRDVNNHLFVRYYYIDENDFIPLTEVQFIVPSASQLNQDVCFDLSVNGDEIREADETFMVTVTMGNSNDIIVGSNTVTVTIEDDNDGMTNFLQFKNSSPILNT